MHVSKNFYNYVLTSQEPDGKIPRAGTSSKQDGSEKLQFHFSSTANIFLSVPCVKELLYIRRVYVVRDTISIDFFLSVLGVKEFNIYMYCYK